MKINEALRLINFRVGTLDDISGRAVNPIINNRTILLVLYEQMVKYARRTKGIEDVYSTQLNTNQPIIKAPSLALRAEPYFYVGVTQNGAIFPCTMKKPTDVFPIFRFNPISGITNWLMPWYSGKDKYFNDFPMKSGSGKTSTLTNDISAVDTTITVSSTTSYVKNNARVTIDNEKILYGRLDATHFYDCVRGMEATDAAAHTAGTTVYENNLVLFYSRLPLPIVPTDDNFIDKSILNRELEIVEEHLEGILDATAYKLLLKIDMERANAYKMDYDIVFEEYKKEIKSGAYRGSLGASIRQPFNINESGTPYGANLMY